MPNFPDSRNRLLLKRLPLILILAIFFSPLFSDAQDRCASDEYRALQQRSGKKADEKKFEKWLREKTTLRKKLGARARTTDEPVKIPVVVHILHQGEDLGVGSNLSEQQVYSQIEVLNEDFQRLNADTILTPSEFVPLAGSVDVEFVLARRDPGGLPSNGIVRKKGNQGIYDLFDDVALKSESYWPAEDYLNIWVCDLTGQNLGYAQFPDIDLPGLENEPTGNRLTDGVVIDYRAFGSSSKGTFDTLRVPFDKGRTATHEVGHFLGLLHIFATPGSCLEDDNVEDTPPQRSDYHGCPSHPQTSCETVDMFQNYMDYTNDACMNLFTVGQVARMQTVLEFAPRRASLINSAGTVPPDALFYDLTVISVNSPSLISCGTAIFPKVTIQNKGTGTITTLALEYGVEGELALTDTISIDSLKSGEQLLLSLEPISLAEGAYEFFVTATILDSEELSSINNSMNKSFAVDNQHEIVPFIEEFEQASIEENRWTAISHDEAITWEIESLQRMGNMAFINLHNYSAIGAEDLLISPILDLSAYSEASLKFNVSYARFVDDNSVEYVDNLAVLVSDDCGNNFEEVYSLSSEDLKVDDTNGYWRPHSAADWKEFVVDISSYAGLPEVRVAFKSTNGYGNNIFIDDIEFFVQSAGDIVEIGENEIILFPNPTRGNEFKLGFNTTERQDVHVQIFDLNGRLVQENYLPDILNQVFTISFEGKRAGVYLIKTRGTTLNTINKLVVNP